MYLLTLSINKELALIREEADKKTSFKKRKITPTQLDLKLANLYTIKQ
jgi:hypothetical protein